MQSYTLTKSAELGQTVFWKFWKGFTHTPAGQPSLHSLLCKSDSSKINPADFYH